MRFGNGSVWIQIVAKDLFLSPNFAFLYFPGMRAPVWAHGGCVGCEVDILTKTWRAMQAPCGRMAFWEWLATAWSSRAFCSMQGRMGSHLRQKVFRSDQSGPQNALNSFLEPQMLLIYPKTQLNI